jgi:hypothetical protein
MLGLNGTSAGDIRKLPRYYLHYEYINAPFVEAPRWSIRDSHTRDWDIVFVHTDKEVCEKVLRLFNEG